MLGRGASGVFSPVCSWRGENKKCPKGGIKLQGTVESFDQFVVLLRNQVSQMVYKHAISTVVPSRNVRIGNGHDGHEGLDHQSDAAAAADARA